MKNKSFNYNFIIGKRITQDKQILIIKKTYQNFFTLLR